MGQECRPRGLGRDAERLQCGPIGGRSLSAWDELSTKNGKICLCKTTKSCLGARFGRTRRHWSAGKGAPERLDEEVRDKKARIIHLERMLNDARGENDALATSVDMTRMESMESENARLNAICEDQGNVIAEMEGKMDQLVDALEKAAEAGLTRSQPMKCECSTRSWKNPSANREWRCERRLWKVRGKRLREMVEQVRGLLEQRDFE
ncbi:MAG: hypothetical protein Ct9H90mP16_14720 [Candidatus Poseidoniales archaeon]|nr:MAG: hypothetical protein Ct9H90mP16_14720 [Candidatus Poseidoniales archaeon]